MRGVPVRSRAGLSIDKFLKFLLSSPHSSSFEEGARYAELLAKC
jgi:hypothetical protein